MKKKSRILLAGILTMVLLAGCSGQTGAGSGQSSQETGTDWPAKTAVTVICPAKAGGGSDIILRYATNAWQQTLGQSLAVKNYENAIVGTQEAINGKGDGYTAFVTHTGGYINYITGANDCDIYSDLRPFASISDGSDQAIICPPDAPYNNMQEFVEYCQANPGTVTWGVSHNSASHFICVKICNAAGIEVSTVEAASEADKLTNVAGGFIDIGNVSMQNAIQYEEAGKIKVLGLVGSGIDQEEYLAKGDNWGFLPTQGIDVNWNSKSYLLVPAATPDEVVAAMNASIKAIYEDDSFNEGLAKMGSVATYLTVDEVEAAWAEECELVTEIAKELGVYVR